MIPGLVDEHDEVGVVELSGRQGVRGCWRGPGSPLSRSPPPTRYRCKPVRFPAIMRQGGDLPGPALVAALVGNFPKVREGIPFNRDGGKACDGCSRQPGESKWGAYRGVWTNKGTTRLYPNDHPSPVVLIFLIQPLRDFMFWKQCQEEPRLSSSLRRASPEPQNPD